MLCYNIVYLFELNNFEFFNNLKKFRFCELLELSKMLSLVFYTYNCYWCIKRNLVVYLLDIIYLRIIYLIK